MITTTTTLLETWTPLFEEFKNVQLINVGQRSKTETRLEYWFALKATTQRGVQKILNINVISFKSQLKINFSDVNTKELLILLSEITDKIVENIDLLNPSFSMIVTFGQVTYPYYYRSKEQRETKRTRPSGVKKADILLKKDKILSFFNELRTKQLPERTPHYDERRVFQIGGTGAKYLVELLIELGIAKDPGKWGSYHTIKFYPEHYVSSLYPVMDEWEKFIRNEIGLQKCFVHIYYVD
jgi:hypothetical protein